MQANVRRGAGPEDVVFTLIAFVGGHRERRELSGTLAAPTGLSDGSPRILVAPNDELYDWLKRAIERPGFEPTRDDLWDALLSQCRWGLNGTEMEEYLVNLRE